VVDLELLRENIRINLERASELPIRIATKSVRCPEVLRLIQSESDRFRGLMTYHGRETLRLAEMGFDDLLLGYPVVEPPLLQRLAEWVRAGHRICFMADSTDHLDLLEEAGRLAETVVPVCLDIDLSDSYPGLHFGVWRSSLRTIADIQRVGAHSRQLAHIRIAGIMGYEAQIAGVGDRVPGAVLKNAVVRWLQRRAAGRAAARRWEAVNTLREMGFELEFVNGGGTGSLESTVRDDSVTEVTVGSGFYGGGLFDQYRDFSVRPALFYGIPVVRKPVAGVYTCHGGGYVASGAVDGAKAPVVHLPEGGRLDPLEGAGEVQTPVRFTANPALRLGDPVFMRYAKAGELLDHFPSIHLYDKDELREVVTYRGME
jgi:D-serine deaminase-like pyridoxal phosphate-dependent protein